MTEVDLDAALFVLLGSGTSELMLALLVMVPDVLGVTLIVIVERAALARSPRLQFNISVTTLHTIDEEVNVTDDGKVSTRETLVAVDGPLLVTVMV